MDNFTSITVFSQMSQCVCGILHMLLNSETKNYCVNGIQISDDSA